MTSSEKLDRSNRRGALCGDPGLPAAAGGALSARRVLPLHVFEPRYRAMLEDCLATHGAMVIAQIIAGEDEHGRPRIARIAGGGIVIEHQPLARRPLQHRRRSGRPASVLEELDPDDPPRTRTAWRAPRILEDLPCVVRRARPRRARRRRDDVRLRGEEARSVASRFSCPPRSTPRASPISAHSSSWSTPASARPSSTSSTRACASRWCSNQLALQHGAMIGPTGDQSVLN